MALTEEKNQFSPKALEAVDELQLKAIIAMEMENALGIDGGKLSMQRRDALLQYEGEPYGDEKKDRSQVVDRTIMETVEWVMPALMRIFTSSDQIVEVEPNAPQDEEQAREMTMAANFVWSRDNEGFRLLYTWIKDALLQKLGWVSAEWEIEPYSETEHYRGLPEDQYLALKDDPDLEEVDCVAYPQWGPAEGLIHQQQTRKGEQPLAPGRPLSPLPLMGATALTPPQAQTVYDVTFRRTLNQGRVKLRNVAPEQVLVSRRATPDHIPFVCEKTIRTRGELIEAGYDRETVMTLSPFDEQEYNTERVARFQKNDEWPYRSSRTDPASVEVWCNIAHLKVDMEGDGIPKWRKIVFGGDKTYTILGNDLADGQPLHSTTPIPQPHTLVGLSLADLVSDLQRIKTTLWRQTLDNLYLTNNPRTYVNEQSVTENTYDDLLTSRPGGIVRGNGPQAEVVQPLTTPFVGQAAIQMLAYLDEAGEKRTGISKGNQGIAPDDLNQNSAVGSMGIGMLQEAAAQRVELIARIFAEDVKKLFRTILGLLIKNQQDERMIRIAGQWQPINPAEWKTQFGLNVTVGLGTGNKDKQVAQLQTLAQIQNQIVTLQQGIQGPLVTAENAYNLLAAMTEAMGWKNPLKFWSDPARTPMPPQQQHPDPAVIAAQIKAQQQAQSDQMTAQIDAQKSQAELQMRERLGVAELQMKFQVEMARLGIEGKRFELDTNTTQQELGLKHQDMALRTQQQQHDQAMAAQQQAHDQALAQSQAAGNHALARDKQQGDHALKVGDQAVKAQAAAPRSKKVTIHRDAMGKVSHATIDEMPDPPMGTLPMGPQVPGRIA